MNPVRKNLIVGILRESMSKEKRAPLTPADIVWLKKRFIDIEVESSRHRIFTDEEYVKAGAKIVTNFKRATLLIGIKQPDVSKIYPHSIYMIFSHTIKGQKENMPFLQALLKKDVTLVDYEKIVDQNNKRLVFFGRLAGIAGCINSLSLIGQKLYAQGITNPFTRLKTASFYKTLKRAKYKIKEVSDEISRNGLDKRISPFIIGITSHGNVSAGVQEILELLNPIKIHPKDIRKFVRERKGSSKKIYQIIFDREEKLRAKDGKGFYFEEYLKHPDNFESNLDIYLHHLNILFHTSYWDQRYPKLVTKKMIRKIWNRHCRLQFIGDISCDPNGAVELTYQTTSEAHPTYTYHPKSNKFVDGYDSEGITIMARDNLPTDLPKDASQDFSHLIREYVYQIAAHGRYDVTNHVALPRELRCAVIVQGRKLAKLYQYLQKLI